MLGVRRWQGVQIDLFQGDITRFACDAMIRLDNDPTAGAQELAAACVENLRRADENGARHIAVSPLSMGHDKYPVKQAAPLAMQAVQSYISGARVGRALGRVTFVLFSAEHYRTFQEALFATFPGEF